MLEEVKQNVLTGIKGLHNKEIEGYKLHLHTIEDVFTWLREHLDDRDKANGILGCYAVVDGVHCVITRVNLKYLPLTLTVKPMKSSDAFKDCAAGQQKDIEF